MFSLGLAHDPVAPLLDNNLVIMFIVRRSMRSIPSPRTQIVFLSTLFWPRHRRVTSQKPHRREIFVREEFPVDLTHRGMDSIVCTALEEICCEGNTGIPLVSLWSRLSPPPPLSPSVKSHVWRNLLSIPQLQFKAKNTVYGSSDPSIQLLEDAHRLDLRIIANEKLRGNFVGLYDAQSNNTTISAVQRRVLERLAVAR